MPFAISPPRLALVASILAVVVAGGARADALDAVSRVDAVTVYPDAAAVTRVASVSLPAGSSTLTFHDLPMGLDPGSIRVEGAGEAAIAIGSVETRVAPSTEPSRDGAIDAKRKALRGQREAWQATLDALEGKKAMMVRFANAGPEKLSPEAKPLDLSQWSAAWDVVGQGLAKVGDELVAARAKAREIDEEIAALDRAGQPQKPRALGREAIVALETDGATKGSISITYRVTGAAWRPAYDARLTTTSGLRASLELVRRAIVTQRTGEDWSQAALSVSTTRAAEGAQAPDVYTQRLTFAEPPVVMGAMERARAPEPSAQAKAAPPPPARPVAAQEQQASLDAGAWQASFKIPGRVDAPGDGSPRAFRIASATLAPDLVIRVAPELDSAAYLQARIVNTQEAALLPGAVNIERDGAFVGVSRIGLVAPGEATELGFGVDDRVTVARVPVRRKENEPSWFGSTKTEQREFKTSVKNLHPFAVKVGVIDRMPISENAAIVIEPSPVTTPPTDKIVDDRRGVMGWRFDLAPNESKDIRLAYRMKWPADRDVVFETLPTGVGRPMP